MRGILQGRITPADEEDRRSVRAVRQLRKTRGKSYKKKREIYPLSSGRPNKCPSGTQKARETEENNRQKKSRAPPNPTEKESRY